MNDNSAGHFIGENVIFMNVMWPCREREGLMLLGLIIRHFSLFHCNRIEIKMKSYAKYALDI